MHLYIKMRFQPFEFIPIHYNYWLQAILYRVMDIETAEQVHDQGFEGEGRIFRLFTFSQLRGRYELSPDKKSIRFPAECQWIVASPIDWILGSIAGGLLRKPVIKIGPTSAEITEVRVEHPTVQGERLRVRTVSPVVAYSTMLKGDGQKYTVYLHPGEPEFRRIVHENLRKKLESAYRLRRAVNSRRSIQGPLLPSSIATNELRLRTLNTPHLHILEYKGGVIKGYSGSLELSGPTELLQIALDAGLGSKNAQGFGCLEVIGQRC